MTLTIYETPERYEERTEKPYPDNGPVWVKGLPNSLGWKYMKLYEAKEKIKEVPRINLPDVIMVIADPPFVPPDDWRPE